MMAKKKSKARSKKAKVTRRRVARSPLKLAAAVDRAPKKPKLKRRAKKPKLNASLAAWRRYEVRQEAIDRENERRLRPYIAKLKAFRATLEAKKRIAERPVAVTVAQKLAELGIS